LRPSYKQAEHIFASAPPATTLAEAMKVLPKLGAQAAIRHFGGGEPEAVTIVTIEDDGRRLTVEDPQGRLHVFTLRRATANFVLDGQQSAPRLVL
jgi:hypothetical protein